jgi:hypothetical protein
MRAARVPLGCMIVLITLSLGSCSKPLVSLNTVTIVQTGNGCKIDPASGKAPQVSASYLSTTPQPLILATQPNDTHTYQVLFTGLLGSPLAVPKNPFTFQGGQTQPYAISKLARSCASAAVIFGGCQYPFTITDTATQQQCDPIVHVTK